ncbi:hypothetical protein [Sphingomonas nostoxanthinifaciens]|uniref:hypothetical protein n=1 Tax=Sphingomonas nostoxanthinifaciens TaxID=2872652 RepID=UPI001CC20AF5|nr:hypothetical protein [Sphingomonas nostoxanthinifaciens]UAK24200.1 hypothetical protein K8P63_18015 [Sphingomonas nostoxanthinifaciens]
MTEPRFEIDEMRRSAPDPRGRVWVASDGAREISIVVSAAIYEWAEQLAYAHARNYRFKSPISIIEDAANWQLAEIGYEGGELILEEDFVR